MPIVRFTPNLKRFYPDLRPTQVEAGTVAEIVHALEALFPGLPAYIVDEHGALRHHVNIFIGNEHAEDRKRLSDPVQPDDEVYILQALSGG